MKKSKSIWQLLIDIIIYLISRRNQNIESQTDIANKLELKNKATLEKLKREYDTIDQKHKEILHIKDISDQLNSRF